MTTFLLLRHATNDWVKKGRLPGWTKGIHLNTEGRAQAQAAADRLKPLKINAVYASHLERAIETARFVAEERGLSVQVRQNLADLRTGQWTGRTVKQVARHSLWKAIQHRPSHTRMPGGESFSEMQSRLVAELEQIAAAHPRGTVLVVSHADAIKVIVAHYLRLHLDDFQRLMVEPASLTVLHIERGAARLVRLNDTGPLQPPKRPRRRSPQASPRRKGMH